MLIHSRYKITKLLGDGTFGRVLLAEDLKDRRKVAIKVIRDIKRYNENAQIEADILKDISRRDPKGESSRSSIMYDTFTHGKHFCLVFEPCGASLYDFLRKNSFRGYWLQDIQNFARQSLSALAFLHDDMRLAHTDLKPENILIDTMADPTAAEFPRASYWKPSSKNRTPGQYMRPASNAIRLIDFGNATYEDEHHSSIINTRQYRSPEVTLALGWDERSDVWSMGCILMELYTGDILFGTHENLEHLALMEAILYPLPSAILDTASSAIREKYATRGKDGITRLSWPNGTQSPSSQRYVLSQKPLRDHVCCAEHKEFADFVGHLLVLDPARRPTASKSLQHPFLSSHVTD